MGLVNEMKANMKQLGEMEEVCGCKTEGVRRWRDANAGRYSVMEECPYGAGC